VQIDQEYEVVDISGDFCPLREHPDNPNQGDDAIVDESVDVNGWYGAVTAQKSTGYILAGNTRFRIAQARGAKQLPVIWKDIDDESALKILLADNATARRADLDEEKVSELLQSLPDIEGTGFADALHPLERNIEAGRVKLTNGTPRDLTPGAVRPIKSDGDPEAQADDPVAQARGTDHVPEPPDPDNIPDDVYTPQYGIIIVCGTEEDQQSVYELCKKTFGDQDIQVRLTAV
jgi:hypothetical protein